MADAATDRRPVVYVETTVFSYLSARKSRNAAIAVRQAVTHEWWDQRTRFRLIVSEAVYLEAERGDASAAARRLEFPSEAQLLVFPITRVKELARDLLRAGALPQKAFEDAGHVAFAAVAQAEYLCSWNFRHLLNPAIRSRVEETCRAAGYRPAIICTPEELTFV